MRTVFFGSGEFALESLERLHALDGPHRLVGVVSRPPRPAGRGKKLRRTPVALRAAELGLECETPETVNAPGPLERLARLEPDLVVVVDYGEFLRKAFRELPRIGAFNLHASLLPAHRGAAPVAHAIVAGEERTGVTLFRIERELDAGPIVDTVATAIRAGESTGELEGRLAVLAADLLERNLEPFARGSFSETAQDASRATLAPRIRKEDGLIDWRLDADAITRRALAYDPWPGAYSFFTPPGKPPERISLWRLRPIEAHDEHPPGTVVIAAPNTLAIRCGRGAVEVLRIQRAGKATLSAGEFLRGHPLRAGDRFGADSAG